MQATTDAPKELAFARKALKDCEDTELEEEVCFTLLLNVRY
jgi:hypothetical protein